MSKINYLEERTDYLKKLESIELNMDMMEKEEFKTKAVCSLTCKICQCVECAKIPGGDV